jgi:hypothetical protein
MSPKWRRCVQREPTDREIADWKESPVTDWWFKRMQDEFTVIAAERPPVFMDDPGKTAMYAAQAEGLRAGFAWAVNFNAERKGEA